MGPRERFDRTICDCSACSEHCVSCPGYLIPGDIERIAKHLGVLPGYLVNNLLASPGALVAKQVRRGIIILRRIPTIVPAMQFCGQNRGRCVFLEPDGRCRIHPVAPYGCAYFDSHMSDGEANRRSTAGLLTILNSPAYHNLWQQLWQAGRRSLPPEEKRRQLCHAGKCVQ